MAHKVLAVDDIRENLSVIVSILLKEGYDVRPVISAKEALKVALADPPDLVLLDIRMPEMSGFEVCAKLKADPATAQIPIIFLSASNEVEDKLSAFREGGADYIEKPFHEDELLVRVRHQIQLKEMTVALREAQRTLEARVEERTLQLERREAQYKRLVEKAPAIFYTWSSRHGYVYANARLREILGFDQQTLLSDGQFWFSRIPAEYREEVRAKLYSAASPGVNLIEYPIIAADGATHWLEDRLIGAEALDGELVVDRLATDVTAQKDVEAGLMRLNQTLEQEVREQVAQNMAQERLLIQQSRLAAMGEMVHNIAHQWRQPINALNLLLANIKDAYEYQELDQAFLDDAVVVGDRLIQKMSSTIDDFRNFFRPNKEKEPFVIFDSVHNAIEMVSAAFNSNFIEIEWGACDKTCSAVGFPNEFAQVVLNLLSNARDAIVKIESSGKVWVAIESGPDTVMVTIRDNGGGIPTEVLPKVFEPYFSTKESGSGIGLYMSRMIMEHMDGEIAACNVEGGGGIPPDPARANGNAAVSFAAAPG